MVKKVSEEPCLLVLVGSSVFLQVPTGSSFSNPIHCLQIATPARYTVTLGGTSLSVKYLRQHGYLSTPPPVKEYIQDKMEETKERLQDKMEETKERLQDKMGETKDKFTGKLLETKDRLHDKMEETKDRLHDKMEETKDSFRKKQE